MLEKSKKKLFREEKALTQMMFLQLLLLAA
jgi:hypothetical protein